MSTSSLSEYWELNPRAVIAQWGRVDARHVQSRHHPQQLGNTVQAGAPNVLLRESRKWRQATVNKFGFASWHGGHLHIDQLFRA